MRLVLALLLPLALAACTPPEPQAHAPMHAPPLWLTEADGPLPLPHAMTGQDEIRLRRAVDFSATTGQAVRAQDALGREMARITPGPRADGCMVLRVQAGAAPEQPVRACRLSGGWRLAA